MTRKILIPVFIVLILFFTVPIFYFANYSQTISIDDKKTVYELPYPGILPDHPLYIFKVFRDKILDFSTRDNLKKVDLYILLSDKRAKMAQNLNGKGKTDLAISTMSKGEKYFLKIPYLLKNYKLQGGALNQEILDKVIASNSKHKEIIQELLKNSPEGTQYRIAEILKLNQTSQSQLENL